MGSSISLVAMIFATYIILLKVARGISVPGYASLMVAVLFLGGIQLIGIGVVGEYLGRAYLESKRRPVYVVRKRFEPGLQVRKCA
jgi:hypothetical protein